jgi:hypothetical protein
LAPGVHAASAAGAVELPVTGGRPQLVLGLALLLLAAVLRPRQARD